MQKVRVPAVPVPVPVPQQRFNQFLCYRSRKANIGVKKLLDLLDMVKQSAQSSRYLNVVVIVCQKSPNVMGQLPEMGFLTTESLFHHCREDMLGEQTSHASNLVY
jgi:hypothetical protein